MISDPIVHLLQTMHLSYLDANNIYKWTKTRFHTSPRSSIGCVQNIFGACGTKGTKRCTYLASRLAVSPYDKNELPLESRLLRVLLGASKTIPKPMVCLAQTVHLSHNDTNTISKWTETTLDMTHVTWSSIECVHNDFRANGTFSANRAPI
jgi:hypothetical protein